MLKAWRLQCPPSEYDLVFCRADGQPLMRSNVLRQGLYPALHRAGLRGGNLKTLRHSYAIGLIAAGAPVTKVQHLLHHSNPSITLKVYGHWFKNASSGKPVRSRVRVEHSRPGERERRASLQKLKSRAHCLGLGKEFTTSRIVPRALAGCEKN
jgi:hypothetical protein